MIGADPLFFFFILINSHHAHPFFFTTTNPDTHIPTHRALIIFVGLLTILPFFRPGRHPCDGCPVSLIVSRGSDEASSRSASPVPLREGSRPCCWENSPLLVGNAGTGVQGALGGCAGDHCSVIITIRWVWLGIWLGDRSGGTP